MKILIIFLTAFLGFYVVFLVGMFIAGKRTEARAIADFIPVAGQLDDAIIVALVLRRIVKSVGVEVIKEHWLGPDKSLGVILKLAVK